MALPSFRDLELRLQRITDVPQLARALLDGAAVIERHGGEYATDELHAAAARLTELHYLATAQWNTVRNFGTPPAPPPKAERQPARSIHAAQHRHQADMRPAVPMSPAGTRVLASQSALPPQAPAPRPSPAKHGRQPLVLARGELSIADVLALTRRSAPWLYLAMRSKGFPRPHRHDACRSVWHEAAVQAWLAAHASARPHSRPASKTHLLSTPTSEISAP